MNTLFEATDSMHHPNRSLHQLIRGWDFVKIWAASVLLLRLFALGKPLPELIIIYAHSYFWNIGAKNISVSPAQHAEQDLNRIEKNFKQDHHWVEEFVCL